MIYSSEVQNMCPVAKGAYHGPAPIPEEGKWVQAKEISDISGLTHGVGWCAPQQGACKLTLNVKNGIIEEALVETVYGRSQTAFSEGGLPIGASLEDLGKGLCGQVGTIFSSKLKGPRYLSLTEGYITRLALDEDSQIIGYEFVHLGKMMESIRSGMDANEALEKAKGHYGRFNAEDGAVKYIDPRKE